MMAAIFTVTWMQRNNEQLAMLAAGISTHRAIRPVLDLVGDRQRAGGGQPGIHHPQYAEEIQKSHDDDGMGKVLALPSRYDSRGIMIHGSEADRATRTIIDRFNATIPVERLRLDPRDRGQAGDLHPGGPPHGAAQGGLADPRGDAQPAGRDGAAGAGGLDPDAGHRREGLPSPLRRPAAGSAARRTSSTRTCRSRR